MTKKEEMDKMKMALCFAELEVFSQGPTLQVKMYQQGTESERCHHPGDLSPLGASTAELYLITTLTINVRMISFFLKFLVQFQILTHFLP